MAKTNLYTLALFALCAFFAVSCKDEQQTVKPVAQNTTVEVANPIKRKVEIWDDYVARLEGEKSVEIRSRVSGYLEKILFFDGQYVKEGQPLFLIDPRPFEVVVENCKASVIEAESKVSLAKSNLNRAEELFAAKAISKETLETRRSEYLTTNALLMSAKAQLKEANLNLEFTKITSPISGYVSRRMVDAGNLIAASDTLMANVVSRATIYAYFEVSERDIINYSNENLIDKINGDTRSGPPVKIKLMDEKTASHTGVLTYIDNKLNSASMELRADVDNSKGKLFPGMYAKASLRRSEGVDRLMLPEQIVGTDLVGRYVLVVNDKNVVEYRAVSVGESIGKNIIILDGLKDSDWVVVKALHRAKLNSVVKPVKVELK